MANLHQLLEGHGREGGERPPHHHRLPAPAAHRRQARPAQDDPAHPGRDEAALLLHPDRRAEAQVRGGERARPLVRRQGSLPLPGERLHAAGRGGRRLSHHPVQDPHLPGAGPAAGRGGAREEAARAAARHRPHGLRQVHHAGVDHRQDQHRPARAHHHHRGPHRVPAPPQELPREPARGGGRHPVLQEGAQVHPAAGSRRGPHRRDAGPRDHRGGARHLRDGSPGLRHPAHQQLRSDHQPHPRRLPAVPAAAGARPAVLRARGCSHPEPAQPGRRARARARGGGDGAEPCHPEPHPRGQGPPDLLSDAGRPGEVRDA